MQRILIGVRPACLGMVLGVLISLSLSNYTTQSGINLPVIAISAVDLVLLLKYKVHIPIVLLFSAGAGLVLFGILGIPIL